MRDFPPALALGRWIRSVLVENEISELEQHNGYVDNVILKNRSKHKITTIFAQVGFKQHCKIPENLNCEITEQGLIKIDELQKTNVRRIYAAGDNSSMGRAVSIAIASGTKQGHI